ncbi:hypothetical protein E2562_011396 [Oryza meyeriana var. granulata]|uniref:Uncharacterized protein n=1 Tax=Oryza meyeriana var. granulata TaxID=110450 RepID=A0A6G1EA73_9ORYZ|nr:hypothetical protein E2562_011396 [Oryza meyeriana var. granulata]
MLDGSKMKGGETMRGGGGNSSSSISPLVSFVLGTTMATICILFIMSASPGHRLADIFAWSSAEDTPLPQPLQEITADANDSLLDVAVAPNFTVVAGATADCLGGRLSYPAPLALAAALAATIADASSEPRAMEDFRISDPTLRPASARCLLSWTPGMVHRERELLGRALHTLVLDRCPDISLQMVVDTLTWVCGITRYRVPVEVCRLADFLITFALLGK